jgi:REP element-mobilizing transposase RayT
VAQLKIKFTATWGGRRKGAGRPPKGEAAGVPHLRRETLSPKQPVHVTLRMQRGAWSLRSVRSFSRLYACFAAGRERFGFRLCEFAVLGNHIHLLVEADHPRALVRGIQGLCIRIAKSLNAMMNRKGPVFADRYHARILKTPTEVRRARRYLATHAHAHSLVKKPFHDPYCSFTLAPRWGARPVCEPATWLLRKGWRRGSPAP